MKRWTPLLVTVITLGISAAAMACPMCKDSIGGAGSASDGSGGPSGALPGGFNTSVYFLLGSLFAVIGMVSFNIVSAVRSTNVSGFPVLPPNSQGGEVGKNL